MNNNSKKIRVIIIAAAAALIVGLAIALASHFWAEDPKATDETATTEALTNADGTCARTYTKSVVEVTKETDGYALYTCSKCLASYKSDYKYATGSEGLKFIPNNSGLIVSKGECDDENIIIPAVVEGKKVRWIAEDAFKKSTNIKSVKILGTLDRIGTFVFAGCTSLTDIYYAGKKEEWEAMPKGDKWDADIPSYTVHCSDGDITK